MTLLFVRHAKALSRSEWHNDDMLRPLSEEGVERAREFFSKLPKIYEKIDIIVSSKATRAIQTAALLKEFFPEAKYLESSKLNPGATPLQIEELIEKVRGYEVIALVGHEPDFSEAIGHLCGCDELSIKIRKGSVTEIIGEDIFQLSALIYPKLLKGL